MQKENEVFINPNLHIYDFGDRFDVVCPSCKKPALVTAKKGNHHQVSFSCAHCGSSKSWKGAHTVRYENKKVNPNEGHVCIGGPFDWYFHYPLLLQEKCCGEVLWACNHKHLEFLESYVQAKQRKDNLEEFGGNRTLASRLPSWMISAANRDRVLKAIAKMKNKKHIKAVVDNSVRASLRATL
jgi:hypothetical protein